MGQQDESTVNKSGDKPRSPPNRSETPSGTTSNVPEIVSRQGLPDSETTNVNHSDKSRGPPSPSILSPPKISSEDDVSNPKSRSVSGSPSNSSDDDFPTSYMPDPGPEIQNPPVQVMERADQEPGSPSAYRIPSHVFARTNTGAPEWSLASNESLFSIHMGNMSFTRELEWLNSEMSGDPLPPLTSDNNNVGGNTTNQIQDNNKPNDPNTSNHQIQANNSNGKSKIDQIQVNKPNNEISTGVDQRQANKFNNISHSLGKSHQDGDKTTEAKAAETMRQVIMESSGADYALSSPSAADRADGSHYNNANTDVSPHSDCSSTKSFVFNLRPELGKSLPSPIGVKQKTPQQTATEPPPREAKRASPQLTRPSSRAPCKWLCCFSRCIK